jgi:hypothetical protein
MASLSAGDRTLHGRPAFTNAVDQNNETRFLVLRYELGRDVQPGLCWVALERSSLG